LTVAASDGNNCANVTWSVNNDKATIEGSTTGNKITLKGAKVGDVTVSANMTGYTGDTHAVKVTTPPNPVGPGTSETPTSDTTAPTISGGSATIAKNEVLRDGTFNVSDNVGVTSVEVKERPAHGQVTNITVANGKATFVYTPNQDYVGTDSFTAVAKDAAGNTSDEARFTISITDDTEAPQVQEDSVTTAVNTPVNIVIKASDNNGGSGIDTYEITKQPSHGTITEVRPGTYQYTPEQDFIGDDEIEVVVTDKAGNRSTPAKITIHVTESGTPDGAPVGEDSNEAIYQGEQLSSWIHTDSTVTKVIVTEQPQYGTVNEDQEEWPDISYLYVPLDGFYGPDEFRVVLENSEGRSNEITVHITVKKKLEESDILYNRDKTIEIFVNETYTSNALPTVDYNNDPISYKVTSEPQNGTAYIEGGNVIKYTPTEGYVGNDSFSIEASNGPDAVIIDFTVIIHPLGDEIVEEHVWYIRGFEDYTVRPEGVVSREQIATIIYRIDTDSQEVYVEPIKTYSDVPQDRWSYSAIMYLTNLNVLQGYEDGTFRPAQTMTRAELAAVVARYAGLDSQSVLPYNDVNEGHWARTVIAQATARGFFTDDDNGTFGPDVALERGYASRVINRLLERNDENAYVDDIPFSDLPEDHRYYHSLVEAFTSHTCTRDSEGNEVWLSHSYPWLQ
jgi:hypothetical protein